jgi:UDP-N-acetylmuramyl pentapeptide phosphotransferase/UDP-N-acetylglucosamine-1-phosphate transferase
MIDLPSLLTIFGATVGLGFALVLTQSWHGRYSLDGLDGVQKLHVHPTPRIGGVAVAVGLWAAWWIANAGIRQILEPILIAALPALMFGLAEDLTKRVGVLPRLLATMASGVVAWHLTGVAMQDTGFPPLDWALQFMPFAVLFTAFAVGGVANAVNIIDGFNGLAAGVVAIMLGALAWMAAKASDPVIAQTCLLLMACAMGFVAINWPMGRIFLGDGGAYLLGFLVAWIAVLLPMRSPDINAWATIMVCAYPVLEVGFSVRRKRKRKHRGLDPGTPDMMHLHHLINRRVVRHLFPRLSPTLQNGLTSPIVWGLAGVPAMWAVVFSDNTLMLALGFALATFLYAALYARLTQFRWCFSALTLTTHPLRPAS